MARVMLDGCLEKTHDNRFDLVLIAAKRAHQLCSGSHKSVLDVGKDKPSVVALREIEAGLIDETILHDSYDFDMNLDNKVSKQGTETMAEVEKELSDQIFEEGKGLNEVFEKE